MNCRRVEPLLSQHLEGRLSERDGAAVLVHLANCPACRRTRAALAALSADLRDLPEPLSSPDLPRRAVQRWQRETSDRIATPFARSRRPLAWAACGVAGLALVVGLVGPNPVRRLVGRGRVTAVSRPDARAMRRLSEAAERVGSREVGRIGVGQALTPVPSPNSGRGVPVRRYALNPPSPKLGRGAGGEGLPASRALRQASLSSVPQPISPGAAHPIPSASDDLAYLNVDPSASAQSWAALRGDAWAALEERLRREVRVRDDFITIPFPRLAAASQRQVAAAVDSYKREAATVDSRLFRKVTLQAKGVSFDEFCRELEKQSGIRIEANRGVADEKVTAFMKDRPLRQVMRQISRLFGYTWLRSRSAVGSSVFGARSSEPDRTPNTEHRTPNTEYRYELAQDLKSQLLEEELRNHDRNEAFLAMDREMQALRPYLAMTPEQIKAKADGVTNPEEKKRLQELARSGWGPLQLYFRLSPEEMQALRADQGLVFSSRPEAGQRPLPEELRATVLGMLSDYRVWQRGDSSGFGPASSVPPDAEQFDPKSAPGIEATASLQISRSELGQFTLLGASGFVNRGSAMSRGGDLATGISPSVASPENVKANAALAHDPALQPVVSWRPESLCRHGVDYPLSYHYGRNNAAAARQEQLDATAKAERDPAPVSVADVLGAIHCASGLDILADSYTRLYPPAEVSVDKRRLFDALNQVADTMRYRWRKEDDMLLFRSAGYFNDRLKEVPNRLLERWAASVRDHGRITPADLLEIAQLRDVQLDSKPIAQGAVRCYGIKGWDLARDSGMRKHLRFLATLTPEQLRLAQTPAGLPFRQMNASQQQQFLFVGWSGSGTGIAPETLPGARLKVDLSLPGEFEWVPAAEWEQFPSERRVRAASREIALAAARRIAPAATAAEIAPTSAAVLIEYGLGPTPDGWVQYSVYAPNWNSGGRRRADAASLNAGERWSAASGNDASLLHAGPPAAAP